jgi:cytochrome oxidase assembly protein ShyY1
VRRLVLRWTLLVVFVIALGVVFVNLGQWQLDRLAERRERNSATVANEAKPVQPFEAVFTHPIGDADQWQRVEARGTFDAEHQFVVRYRTNGDDRGYEVVTPLRTSSGIVLVDRGFVATDRAGEIPATAPPPPAGEVTVVGHARRNEQGRRAAVTPSDGQVRLINSEAIGAALGEPVYNGYISAVTVTPPQTGGFVPVQLPDINEGPHFWYAVQWFGFAGLAAAGIVVFIRADVKARREHQPSAAARV